MPVRNAETCVRCHEKIERHESAVAISLFCQTVGMGKRRASKSERIYLCPQCSVVTAMGDEPPKGQPLNVAAYRIIRNLVGSDPEVAGKAWEELNNAVGIPTPPALTVGEVLPPARRLRAAV